MAGCFGFHELVTPTGEETREELMDIIQFNAACAEHNARQLYNIAMDAQRYINRYNVRETAVLKADVPEDDTIGLIGYDELENVIRAIDKQAEEAKAFYTNH